MKATENEAESIGELIRIHREKMKMTQTQLAKQIGWNNPQFVSLMERDIAKVPFYRLRQLMIILKIPKRALVDSLVTSYKVKLETELSGEKIKK